MELPSPAERQLNSQAAIDEWVCQPTEIKSNRVHMTKDNDQLLTEEDSGSYQ